MISASSRRHCRLHASPPAARRSAHYRLSNAHNVVACVVVALLTRLSGAPPLLLPVSAAVPCSDTTECESILRRGSECVDGACSNPFGGGCLRRYLGLGDGGGDDNGAEEAGGEGQGKLPTPWPLRACNSDDPPGAAGTGLCSESEFDYPEIRISNGNWESSIFITWAIQIILSELVGVPVSVETGKRDATTGERIPGATTNFYSPTMDFTFSPKNYNWDGIREVGRVPDGDCRRTSKDCCHVMPEVWSAQRAEIDRAVNDGYIEPASSLDTVGKLGIYVPKFTAARDASLTSMLGLAGESNREKLARIFKRPTTWGLYCEEFSPTKCDPAKEYDGVARRPPADDSEGAKYYSEGDFRGYFRYTDKNDCSNNSNNLLNPSKCTGHFVAPICEWSQYTEGQIYWNDIALSSDGTVPPYGTYAWSEMIQIWTAANETQSDVIMYWWRPDWVPHVFRGGPGEFVPVTLAESSQECASARIDTEAKCSVDPIVRRGTELGSCDYEPFVLKKVLTSSLRRSSQMTEDVDRSPAYELIRAFRITDLVLDMLLRMWIDRGVDKYGYDGRDVVCGWVAENIGQLRQFLPEGYPRHIVEEGLYEEGYLYAAMGVAGFTICVTIATAVLAYLIRNRKVIRYAQPVFMMLILFGFLLVGIGAVLFATEPSEASCVARQWLIMLGYSLELVPLITKLAAINKMMQHAKKMRRVQVDKKRMLGMAAAIIGLVLAYLSIWTALDPPTRREERVLTGEVAQDDGGAYVEVGVECSSSSSVWALASMGWQVVLLLCATVLVFQTRNVRQEFNESQRLCFMVYSHFFFVTMRLITLFLSDIIRPNVLAGVTSFLLSLDTLVTLLIYFVPKFWEAVSPGSGSREPPPGGDTVEAIRQRSTLMTSGADRRSRTSNRESLSLNEFKASESVSPEENAISDIHQRSSIRTNSGFGLVAENSNRPLPLPSGDEERRGDEDEKIDDEEIDAEIAASPSYSFLLAFWRKRNFDDHDGTGAKEGRSPTSPAFAPRLNGAAAEEKLDEDDEFRLDFEGGGSREEAATPRDDDSVSSDDFVDNEV